MARAEDPGSNPYFHDNAVYWFEHELRQYPAPKLDIDALATHADRMMLASGRESRGRPAYEVNVELEKKLGLDMIELPGGHAGFVAHPAGFATELMEARARS